MFWKSSLIFFVLVISDVGTIQKFYPSFWGYFNPAAIYREPPQPPKPPQTPLDVIVDITNDLGVAILQDHSNSRANFAFSPYGVASVLVILFEGARGESARQIHRALRFPPDREVMRIGFKDLHQHLRSYFNHEGFLSGITLNKEGSTLKPEYKQILKYYGYDIDLSGFVENGINETTTTTTTTTSTSSQTNTTTTTVSGTTEASPTTNLETNTTTTTVSSTPEMQATTSPENNVTTQVPILGETTITTNAETNTPSATVSSMTEVQTTTNVEANTTTPVFSTTDALTVKETEAEVITTAKTMEPTTQKATTTSDTEVSSMGLGESNETTTEIITTTTQIEDKTTTDSSSAVSSSTATNSSTVETTTISGTSLDNGMLIPQLEDLKPNPETTTNLAETTNSTGVGTDTSKPLRNKREVHNLKEATQHLQMLLRRKKTIAGNPELNLQFRNGMYDAHVFRHSDYSRGLPRLLFLLDGIVETPVPMMTFTTVFPFGYIHELHAKALEFPLDDVRYKLLILLPMESKGLRRLIYDLSNVSIRDVVKSLRPTRVKTTLPTFMVEGFVVLTSSLQKCGIVDVFDPYRSDLSGMSPEPELYVRNIEQSVTVVIKNYVEVLDIETRTMAGRNLDEEFEAVYPFLYFVLDSATNVALMAGQMVNPLITRMY